MGTGKEFVGECLGGSDGVLKWRIALSGFYVSVQLIDNDPYVPYPLSSNISSNMSSNISI